MAVIISKLTNRLRIAVIKLQGCQIGKNCAIGKNVKIIGKKNISIGNNVTIEDNVRLKVKNYSKSLNDYQLIIKNNIFVGYGTVIDVNSQLIIQDNCMFGPYCFVTDSNHIHKLDDEPFAALGGLYRDVTIGANCWIGSHCVILSGVNIGKNSIIAANSVVNKDL